MSALAASAAARTARYVGNLRLLTVNDVYAANPIDGCGGWATLSTMLAQHRTPDSLVCINGDFLGGSALAEHFKGKNVIDIMNNLGTDIVVLGNHEFDYGGETLKERMAESNFTWLGSNVLEKTTPESTDARLMKHVQDLHQVQVRLERAPDEAAAAAAASATPTGASPFPASTQAAIGMFGLCTPRTPQLSWPGPLVSFSPINPVTQDCIARLKGQTPVRANDITYTQLPRAAAASPAAVAPASPLPVSPSTSVEFAPSDALIAVTHLSFAEDRRLAREFGADVQVVIGGHDHDPMAIFENNTLVFKAGQNALWLGIIDLAIEVTLTEKTAADGTTTMHRATTIFPSWNMVANRGYAADPRVQQVIDASIAQMEKDAGNEDQNEVICRIEAPLALPPGVELTPELQQSLLVTKTSAVRKSSSSFADMIADAMAYHYAEDGCEGAIINGGFVRGDKVYAQGTDLLLKDIRYELPFPKVVVLLEIAGRGILQALNEMLIPHPNPSGSFPHISKHFTVEFDASQPQSKSKVTRVTHNGQPLDLDRVYRLSVTTFMASGGDGVTGFSQYGTIISKDQYKVADIVLKYLRGIAVLHPNIVPRLTPTGTGMH